MEQGQFDTDLTALGLNLLDLISMIISIESEFDCEILDSKLLLINMNTVREINSYVV